jgi:hypothetical protein
VTRGAVPQGWHVTSGLASRGKADERRKADRAEMTAHTALSRGARQSRRAHWGGGGPNHVDCRGMEVTGEVGTWPVRRC